MAVTEEAKLLMQERRQIKKDMMDNKIPKRVFLNISLNLGVVSDYAGLSRKETMWHPELISDAVKEICEEILSDVTPWGGNVLQPSVYQAMDARNIVMGDTGFMQHPNVHALDAADWDDFIKDPYACILEKAFPRIYKGLDYVNDPVRSLFTYAQMFMATAENGNAAIPKEVSQPLKDRFGWYAGYVDNPAENCSAYTAFDFLTDQLRSFSGMMTDIHRIPDKILEALEAVYPLSYKQSLPGKQSPYSSCGHALHMGTFMNNKDFAKFFWPYWKRENEDHAAAGIRTSAFCEHDWMRYLDYLEELPAQSQLQFEYGDWQTVKDRLGKRHILSGMFPITDVNKLSKEELITKVRRYLDTMMPGGNFEFKFDKSALVYSDVNLENLRAIADTVYKYGVYDNAGQTAGVAFDSSLYTDSGKHDFSSKYYRTWEQYKAMHPNTPESAKGMVMSWEEAMFKRAMFFCK